ncbi:MAG: RcnB family protein [Pseudomonadota bacterium]|nr:RcnB family protein [Pseudomonadota bacterium]
MPYQYRRAPIYNYYDYGYAPPPYGHAYYRTDTGQIVLAAIATGLILAVLSSF